MGDASFVQSNFLGGEWSPIAQGRADLPEYRTAMNKCYNAVLMESGCWTPRPGTREVSYTRSAVAGKLLKFGFEQKSPYNIEITDGFFRFQTGTRMATTNDAVSVSSISTATPAVVTTASAHGWSTDDQVIFDSLSTNNAVLQNRTFSITVLTTTTFSIADAITATSIDGSAIGTFVSGTVKRILEIATPYTGGTWQSVRGVQSQQAMTFLHKDIKPRILQVDTLPTSSEDATFTFDEVRFLDGPYLEPVKGGAQIAPSAVKGVINLTITFTTYDASKAYSIGDFVLSSSVNYVSLTDANVGNTPASSPSDWEAVSPGICIGPDGFQGSDVGRHMRLYSEPADWATATAYALGDVVRFVDSVGNITYWKCISAHTSTDADYPGADATKWAVYTLGAKWSWGRITGLASLIDPALAGSVNITDNMTSEGGVAAAFDTDLTQVYTSCAAWNPSFTVSELSPTDAKTYYIGKDYSGASAQSVASATIWPSTTYGYCKTTAVVFGSGGGTLQVPVSIVVNMRGSSSSPAAPSDGTLLGTSGTIDENSTNAISVQSTDQSTTFNYIWLEVIITYQYDNDWIGSPVVSGNAHFGISEVQFFSPSGTGSVTVSLELVGDDLLYTTPINVWRMGVYSDTTGWPICGTYHQGRIWLAGSIGNRIDASEVFGVDGNEISMAPTESDGTVTSANGISYIFDSPDVNPIFWMLSVQQGIICGTQADEWLVQPTTLNEALTPTNIKAHPVTSLGCANVEPRKCAHTVVFVQAAKRRVQEYFADVYSGKFASPDLCWRARHLTLQNIEEIAYQAELSSTIWARTGDGGLIGCAYSRTSLVSSHPPESYGWHDHDLGSARTIDSICVGPSTDGTLDSLSMITADSNSFHHIEIMTDFPDEATTLLNSWFLDSAVAPTYYTDSGGTDLEIGGLWPLEGESVTVFAGGLDLGEFTVGSGIVTVPYGSDTDGLFTSAYVTGFSGDMQIAVGYTYNSDGQITRPASAAETGARNGPGLGKIRRLHHYALLLETAKGLSVGTDFDNLNAALFRTSPHGGASLTGLQAKSGFHVDSLGDESGYDGMLAWRIARPYPGFVLSAVPFLHTQDQ